MFVIKFENDGDDNVNHRNRINDGAYNIIVVALFKIYYRIHAYRKFIKLALIHIHQSHNSFYPFEYAYIHIRTREIVFAL